MVEAASHVTLQSLKEKEEEVSHFLLKDQAKFGYVLIQEAGIAVI